VPVTEPSDVIKRRNGYTDRGTSTWAARKSPPSVSTTDHTALWFGLAWLGLAWLGLAWLGLAHSLTVKHLDTDVTMEP